MDTPSTPAASAPLRDGGGRGQPARLPSLPGQAGRAGTGGCGWAAERALPPQSSLYSEEGLGVAVLSTLYGAMLLSSMFLPPLLIRTLGCKWTIVAAMSCYVTFSLGNFYASWYSPRGARHQAPSRAAGHLLGPRPAPPAALLWQELGRPKPLGPARDRSVALCPPLSPLLLPTPGPTSPQAWVASTR